MKCPKCGYLGFEQADRCRNCGYDFALAQPAPDWPELPLRAETKTERFADLPIAAPPDAPQAPATAADLDKLTGPPTTTAAPASASRAATAPGRAPAFASTGRPVAAAPPAPAPAVADPSAELPLFGGPITDDVPLITKASPPRPPLAVRRATPEVPRVRSEAPRPASLDLALDVEPAAAASAVRSGWPQDGSHASGVAGVGARLLAAAIDLVVLAIVDVVVIYFTLQICSLRPDELALLPKAPLIAFLVLQNIGYLIAFTAGGQTLGKMAAGIKVVTAESDESVDVWQATLRTLCWVALAAPAGLGFITALFNAERRGLHDRFAGTRVIRTAA